MKDYSEVSRFEINKAVAGLEGLFWHCSPSSDQNDTGSWIYSDNYCDCDTKNGQVAVELPDYCNSWADMGSIIEREYIGLNYIIDEWEAHNGEIDQGGMVVAKINIMHKNPLRAAAIVYLMSKDSEQ